MSYSSLSFTLLFVVLAMILSTWLRLGLSKDLIVATVRSAIQLIVIGYILKWVFGTRSIWFILLMVTVIVGVATQNATTRGKGLRGIWWRVLIAIATTEIVTQALLLTVHVIPFRASYVIPISGMITGNAMVVAGLFLTQLRGQARDHEEEILVVLALGGTPRRAVFPFVKNAIKASMIPTIDSTKTTGLVQLPGTMSGLIIAGADPVQAVRYQLMILFSIMASAALTSIVLAFLTYGKLFNEHDQLELVK